LVLDPLQQAVAVFERQRGAGDQRGQRERAKDTDGAPLIGERAAQPFKTQRPSATATAICEMNHVAPIRS
jgi:hypothetical protein